MPKMSGYELYNALRKKDPSAKIHFLSAFEFWDGVPKAIVSDLLGKNFIAKPISIKKLIEIISSALGDLPPNKKINYFCLNQNIITIVQIDQFVNL